MHYSEDLRDIHKKITIFKAWEGLRDISYNGEIYNAIYRFEIMILVHVKAKSLLCYWAVAHKKRKYRIKYNEILIKHHKSDLVSHKNSK